VGVTRICEVNRVDVLKAKVSNLIQWCDKKYEAPERPVVMPPPASADAAAASAVSVKNAQALASVVLGLHGAPREGIEAARKLLVHFVDWNEVRVSRPSALVSLLGRQPNAATRVALLQRFLEAFFLRQRNLHLDHLYTLKLPEAKRFLSELEVFDREELAAVYLVGFNVPVFPPSERLHALSEEIGLIKPKTTTLQMAKKYEDTLSEDMLFPCYSHLYSLSLDEEARGEWIKKYKKR